MRMSYEGNRRDKPVAEQSGPFPNALPLAKRPVRRPY
jgi:hypothetical protein